MHMLPGRVSAVDESSDGKHATVTVTHGKRKRSKNDKGEVSGELQSYHQPSSRVVMPKKHAAHYPLGTKVPAMGTDDETDEEYEDDEEAEGEAAKTPKGGAGKRSAPPPKKRAAADRPILRAMTSKRKK